MKAGQAKNKLKLTLTFLGPNILTVKLNRSIPSLLKINPCHSNKRTKTIQTWLILKVFESIKTVRREGKRGKIRTRSRKNFKRRGGNQWASFLFGDKQVQKSIFNLFSCLCFASLHSGQKGLWDFSASHEHLRALSSYSSSSWSQYLKAKLPVEVNCDTLLIWTCR